MAKYKVAIVLILFTSLLFSSCNRHIAQHKETKQYYYDCPIHKEYISYSPGKCPKCGLTLDQWDMENMPKKSGNSHSGHSSSGTQSGHGGH